MTMIIIVTTIVIIIIIIIMNISCQLSSVSSLPNSSALHVAYKLECP